MNGLALISSCTDGAICKPNIVAPKTKSTYIAAAIVEKGVLATNNFANDDITNDYSKANGLITQIRTMQLAGTAVFIPSPHISGSKPSGEDIAPGNSVYGLRIDPKPDGTKRIVVTINYENFYTHGNVSYFNALAKNRQAYDLVLWTENTVSVIEGADIDFIDVGYEVVGNAGENIDGHFSARWIGTEPIPYPHNTKTELDGYTTLTIAPDTATGDLSKVDCAGKCDRYFGSYDGPGATGTIPLTLVENASCVTWDVVVCGGGTVPAGVTITANGIITVTNFTTETITRMIAIASTDSCVVGEYCFEISAASI